MKTRTWIIIILTVFLLCLAAVVIPKLTPSNNDSWIAEITLDGECIRRIPLNEVSERYTFTVTGGAGVNTIAVENDRIRVEKADCPDQVCVHHGWESDGVDMIVCLPNKLVIRLIPSDNAGESKDTAFDGEVQ